VSTEVCFSERSGAGGINFVDPSYPVKWIKTQSLRSTEFFIALKLKQGFGLGNKKTQAQCAEF